MDTDLKFRKFFSLVPDRQCGDCVTCCHIPSINSPKLKKPADVLCPNCASPGCRIYESRPVVCRKWFCLWRRLDMLATGLRPDKSKVMLSLEFQYAPRNVLEKAYIIGRTLESWEVFYTPEVDAALRSLIEEFDLPIWINSLDKQKLLYPRAEMAQEILHPGSAGSAETSIKAKEWLSRYEERASRLLQEDRKFRLLNL